MSNKPLCFIISPIGEADSETRKNADYLLDLIIQPALAGFDFEILRGDHCHTPNQIHEHVVQCIRDAALCIADISLPNVNVYYEIGRRDETGKPLILLRRRDAGALPIDLGTRRYIHYSLDAEGITRARNDLKLFVQELAKAGFEAPRPRIDNMEQMMLQLEQRLLQKLNPQPAAPKPEKAKASVFGSLLPKSQKNPTTTSPEPAAMPVTPAKFPTDMPPAAPVLSSAVSAPAKPAKPQPRYTQKNLDALFDHACKTCDITVIDQLLDDIRAMLPGHSPEFIYKYCIPAWQLGSKKALDMIGEQLNGH